jgi:hypothetical protein
MGLLSVVSKTILVYTCVIWMFAIVGLLVMGQTFLAVIATVTFMLPLYMVISEYLKLKNKQKLWGARYLLIVVSDAKLVRIPA